MRALIFDFLSSHARMLLDWADRTEGAVDSWQRPAPPRRDQAARTAIARILDGYPPPPEPRDA